MFADYFHDVCRKEHLIVRSREMPQCIMPKQLCSAVHRLGGILSDICLHFCIQVQKKNVPIEVKCFQAAVLESCKVTHRITRRISKNER